MTFFLARSSACRAWELGSLLDWALERARAAGFTSVTVACEPTGHRWRVRDQLAAERGLPPVCVQPLLVWRACEAEDLTWDTSIRKTPRSSLGWLRSVAATSRSASTPRGPDCGTSGLGGQR